MDTNCHAIEEEGVTTQYPSKQPVAVQQGGSTFELYLQLPENIEEYITDCEEHTYLAVDAGEIEILGVGEDGEELVTLTEACRMAQACLDAVRKLVCS